MGMIVKFSRAFWLFLIKNKFALFAVAVYLFFTVFYMGPAFYKCSDSVYGFGDSTGGPIWRNSLDGQPLLGGYEDKTDFPMGESLYSPVNVASFVQAVFTKTASQVVGPVCSYNLYNITGYITTSVLMFAFILYLTRSKWIALLAGYAAAFTPYVQSKIGGHPSYAYGALIIALIWLGVHLAYRRKKVHAILLGVVLSICAYIDPYFILLATTVMMPVIVLWLVVALRRRQDGAVGFKSRLHKLWQTSRPLLLALLVFGVLVSPLVFIRIKDAAIIDASVSGVRGNVVEAAMLCSNTPIDYLIPDPLNVYLVKTFGVGYINSNILHRSWCGYGESRVSISLTIIAIITLGVLILFWEKINKRRIYLSKFIPYPARSFLPLIIAVGLVAVCLGLPPYIHGVITPSGVILRITATWRIFAREYVVVNTIVVILFSITLKYFASVKAFKNKKIVKAILYSLISVLILMEYQINPPFNPPVFSYSRDVPSVYYQVRDNQEIQAIAEYPIDRLGIEYDSAVYYLTMQAVHKKSIMNSASLKDVNGNLHLGIRDLSDPQTLPVLRYLGIKYVVIHAASKSDIASRAPDLEIIGYSNPSIYSVGILRPDNSSGTILARIKDGPKRSSVTEITSGLESNTSIIKSPIDSSYQVTQRTVIQNHQLDKNQKTLTRVCFDVRPFNAVSTIKSAILVKDSKGAVLSSVIGDSNYVRVQVDTGSDGVVNVENESGSSLELNNLGC